MENTENDTKNEPCSNGAPCSKGFNYCFWAKLIVAIPALPLLAVVVGSLFTNPAMQYGAGIGSAVFAVWLAIKVDRMKIFSGMVVKK